jgi:hypothetical protein
MIAICMVSPFVQAQVLRYWSGDTPTLRTTCPVFARSGRVVYAMHPTN